MEIDIKTVEEKIKTHCDEVMQAIVSDAGTAGKVVSKFVSLPNKDGVTDNWRERYYERAEIEDQLSTSELKVELGNLSVSSTGTLEYWLYIEVRRSDDSEFIEYCNVGKYEGELELIWDSGSKSKSEHPAWQLKQESGETLLTSYCRHSIPVCCVVG
jgi:hypothetical protein